ncbi:MAG: sigma-E processing peptidase SpoIIGA [Ruminococcus sp.]|nr:sigma-E processing peptidase SpoIIGA [Ruminococcus sp.]
MYIYVDILIITNIYVDFLLISSTAAITHSRLKTWRGIAAAVLGGLFSLVIFLPRIPPLGLAAVKLLSAVPIVLTEFGYESKEIFIKRIFLFFMASFIFAGAGSGLSSLLGGRVMVSRNGVVYGNFSMPVLIGSTVGAYAVIRLYKRAADVSEKGGVYTVTVRADRKTVSFRALADTGNALTDVITGKPVIIADRRLITELFGHIPAEEELWDIPESPPQGGTVTKHRHWRLIPCKTVSGNALIPIIRPDEAAVKNEETGQIRSVDIYLGASPNDCEFAVFNPKIL